MMPSLFFLSHLSGHIFSILTQKMPKKYCRLIEIFLYIYSFLINFWCLPFNSLLSLITANPKYYIIYVVLILNSYECKWQISLSSLEFWSLSSASKLQKHFLRVSFQKEKLIFKNLSVVPIRQNSHVLQFSSLKFDWKDNIEVFTILNYILDYVPDAVTLITSITT